MIERLETRTLLTSSLSGPVLFITGTSGHDVIRFTSRGTELLVWEGKVATAYPIAAIATIEVYAGPGNDRVRLGAAVRVGAKVDAGDGKDLVIGGAAADTLLGGFGRDRLFGGRGADTIVVGGDIDRFFGGAGNDTLDSADGVNDFLSGGAGRDSNNTYADSADSVEIRPSRPRGGGNSSGGGGVIDTGAGIGFSRGISIVDNVP